MEVPALKLLSVETAEQRLWFAVLTRAILDYLDKKKRGRQKLPYSSDRERGYETLHDFFYSETSESLDSILSNISPNPEELKNQLRRWLKKPTSVNTRSLAKQLHTPNEYRLKKKFPV